MLDCLGNLLQVLLVGQTLKGAMTSLDVPKGIMVVVSMTPFLRGLFQRQVGHLTHLVVVESSSLTPTRNMHLLIVLIGKMLIRWLPLLSIPSQKVTGTQPMTNLAITGHSRSLRNKPISMKLLCHGMPTSEVIWLMSNQIRRRRMQGSLRKSSKQVNISTMMPSSKRRLVVAVLIPIPPRQVVKVQMMMTVTTMKKIATTKTMIMIAVHQVTLATRLAKKTAIRIKRLLILTKLSSGIRIS